MVESAPAVPGSKRCTLALVVAEEEEEPEPQLLAPLSWGVLSERSELLEKVRQQRALAEEAKVGRQWSLRGMEE